MDDVGSRIKRITHELKDYVETRLELTMLNFSDKMTYWIGQSVQNVIAYTILGIGLVFAMTALAIFLGDVLDAEWAGYAIVSAPFIIAGLVIVIKKPKGLARRIQNQILAELIDSLKDEEEELKQLPGEETFTKGSEKNG